MRFPHHDLVPYGKFTPSLRLADSYVGATSGPRLGPGGIFVGLLSSGTLGRLIHRSHGVTPSSVAPECLGDAKRRAGARVHSCVVLMYARFNRGSLAVWGDGGEVNRFSGIASPVNR